MGARGSDQLRSAAAVLQRATAAPWRASASRRRPPLRGRCEGGQAGELSRGCGVPGPRPQRWGWGEANRLPRAAARLAGHSGLNLQGLIISFQARLHMARPCLDPLPRSGSARPVVRLHW